MSNGKRKEGMETAEDEHKSVRPKRYNKKLKLIPGQSTSSKQTDTLIQHSNVNEEAQQHHVNEEIEDFIVEDEIETNKGHQLEESDLNKLDFEKTIKELLENVDGSHRFDEDIILESSDEEEIKSDNEDWEAGLETENNEEEKSFSEATLKDRPIYNGHSMTVGVSLLLILLYTVTHGISGSQLNDLLVLIGLHCAEEHPGLKSLFHFKQYFAGLKSPLVKHFFCIYCLSCVDEKNETCSNTSCGKNIKDAKSKSYFIEVPLDSQLQTFFQRPNFPELIKHRFSRKKKKDNNVEDIYDGALYQRMSSRGGVLSDTYPHNISFTLNTDGVPLFKSSKFSIWPVYLMINELPFKHRKRTENMLFAGLWFGDTKPFLATFFRPIHKNLKKLENEGLNVNIAGKDILCKAFLICTTADLPAKSLLMNMNQFNGASSCSRCREKGETYKTTAGGCVHVFPFNRELPLGEERTTEMCKRDAIQAVELRKAVNGIKGPSFLMTFQYYDYVKGACQEYMHGVCLGVSKLMNKLWFSTTYSKEDFSISQYSEEVDQNLLKIKPPSFVTRIPRSIVSHFKYWKASELRSWLFFYSLPLLHDIMSESYYIHYAAYVEAIYLLCGTSISQDDLVKSKNLLTYFVMTFSTLYGERYMTLNIHQLLHLPDCVRDLGPLWAYSCFYFESANGDITKLFHGTQNVELQILSSINIIQTLPALIDTIPQEFKPAAQKLFPKRVSKPITAFHVQFLGKGYDKLLTNEVMQMLMEMIGFEVPKLTFYSRVLLRGEMYHSRDYTRVLKRNNMTVKYFCVKSKLFKFGYIQRFVTHEGNKVMSFAIVCNSEKRPDCVTSNLSVQNDLEIMVPHVYIVKPTDKLEIVGINNLLGICVNIEVQNGLEKVTYICEPPNRMETD